SCAAGRRRIAVLGPRYRISRYPHPLPRHDIRRCHGWSSGRLPGDDLHGNMDRGNDRRARMDRPSACRIRNLEAGARTVRIISLWWRHNGAIVRPRGRHSGPSGSDVIAALCRNDPRPGPDHSKPHAGSHECATRIGAAFPCPRMSRCQALLFSPPASGRVGGDTRGRVKMPNLTRRKVLQLSAVGLVTSVGGAADVLAEDGARKVGVVHQGPISDTGWESFHARAWRAMEAAFPGKVKATVLDNILQAQDAERVFRQLASQGHKLLIGT